MNLSIRSLANSATASSMATILRGANSGSSNLRYFFCSGGSICSGIIGRLFLRSTASMLDEKISGWRRASSISALRLNSTPMPSIGMTGTSRMALKTGCGWAAISGSMPLIGFSPVPSSSVSSIVSIDVLLVAQNSGRRYESWKRSRPEHQQSVDRLHEGAIIGFGNDEARREEANDHVGQLLAAEIPGSHSGNRVEGVAQLLQ